MMIPIHKSLLIRHLLSWIAVAVIFQLINQLHYPIPILIIRAILEIIILMIPYYLIAFFISPVYSTNKIKRLLLIIAVFPPFLCLYYLLENGLDAYMFQTPFSLPAPKWIVNVGVYFTMLTLLSIGFYNNQVILQKMAIANKIEQDKLKHSILFLKNKYNHNIGYGFLEYCEQLFKSDFEQGSKAIAAYKNMLSNTLSIGAAQTVSVQSEIQYIEQFLNLHQIIHEKAQIKFIKTINTDYPILPRILITYIENALKYGISNDEQKPISIHLQVQDQELELTVSNYKKRLQKKTPSTQTGQINAQQQLDLYYHKNYTILVDENDYHYQLKLKLLLKKYD